MLGLCIFVSLNLKQPSHGIRNLTTKWLVLIAQCVLCSTHRCWVACTRQLTGAWMNGGAAL